MPNQGITFRGGINVLKRFLIGGTEVTATAAEINTVCDDATVSAAELNVLDGVSAGTVTASKAVVVGADKNIDTIAIAASGLKIGAGAGTAVTATAAELNTAAGVTAGTVTASKAVVVDANKDIASFRNLTATGNVTAGAIVANDNSLDVTGLAATSAGNGGAVALVAGQAHTNGIGGAITVTAGAGSATGTGAGGAASLVAGASGGGATGNGGVARVTGGAAASTDGAGGAALVTGGAGKGAANGGAASVTGGLGGDGATGNGGAGNLIGGAAASTNGDGGDVAVTGGAATGTGTGGDVSIASGASAGATGTAGSITMDTGDPATGTGGTIAIGGTNATDVAIGRVGGTVTLRGTGLTATATELNYLASAGAAGTATASKVPILGADKNLDEFHTAALYLGAAAGTQVTATAAELNTLDGGPHSASFVVGAEGGNQIVVEIQLKDANAADLAVRGSVFAYLSDDANGDSVAATAPDGGWAIGTDGVLIPVVAGKAAQLISESDGDIDIAISETAGATWYLILVMPNGKLLASGAITFAA